MVHRQKLKRLVAESKQSLAKIQDG